MDRLSQTPSPEPIPPDASGGSVLRTTLYGLLALMLAGGAWVRFNDQIATVAPAVAAPVQATAQGLAQDASDRAAAGVQSLLELPLLARTAEPAAVAGLGLPTGQATQITAALRRDRLRLVQLPLFDAGASLPDGSDAGRAVLVSSGGFSRIVHLGRQPVVVTLPIDRAGTVAFKVAPNTGGVIGIGALTADGPVTLPDLTHGQELDVGVIAQ
jgi:hypothetical protein